MVSKPFGIEVIRQKFDNDSTPTRKCEMRNGGDERTFCENSKIARVRLSFGFFVSPPLMIRNGDHLTLAKLKANNESRMAVCSLSECGG